MTRRLIPLTQPHTRQTPEHHAMVLAALRAGAHVSCEKPFTTTLAEADELLAEQRQDEWRKLAEPAGTDRSVFASANKIVVGDWLAAIAEKREPECNGRNATKAIEMGMAVYQAALAGRRVPFPLAARPHPLATGQR